MTPVTSSTGVTMTWLVPPPTIVTTSSTGGLPSPLLEALNPADPLGEMLAILERMNQTSTRHTERELRDAGEKLKGQLDKFLKMMADAVRRARQAAKKKKRGGFLRKVAGSVGSVVGGAVGKVLATATMSPSLEKKIEGFTKGALLFSSDLAGFQAKLAVALATAGPDAERAWKDVKSEAKALAESFVENCIGNPDFMEVVGMLAKTGALAAAIGSGGTLAWLAVAAFTLTEVDARTDLVGHVVGQDAAPWVRLGMNVACSALLGAAGGEGAIRYLTSGAAVLQGASNIHEGITLVREAKERANELRRGADLQETLDRMHALQRLIDDLLLEMQEHAESRDRSRTLSSSVVQIQAETQEAVVLRG